MDTPNQYRIWAENMSAGAPLELPALVTAIKSGKVQAGTWLYLDHERTWRQASQVPELNMFFRGGSSRAAAAPAGGGGASAAQTHLKPGTLRRIKLLAELNDQQLETFVGLMEVLSFPQFAAVVEVGQHGDSMFLVLEGEVRARNMIDGRETTLSTIGVGDFFGEIALLDHGPRSADVIANTASVLLKISSAGVERLVRECPAVAAPFLLALSRATVGRLRKITKKYQDSIHFSRLAGAAS
jgi:hypothetical protein